MHWVAGGLLVVDFVLMWILDKAVVLNGLEYVGCVAWVLAMILLFLPMATLRRRGRVPSGESYVATKALVDSGIYALVRHPQYLGWMLMYLVVLLFNPNWVLATISVLGVACVCQFTWREEQHLVERFGTVYRRYMQRVPRFNLPAGIIRWIGERRR